MDSGTTHRSRGWLIAALTLALAAVIGVIAAFVVLRDNDAGTDPGRAAEPVESTPDQAWRWTHEDVAHAEVWTAGDVAIVGDSSSEAGLWRLDADGQEVWHTTDAHEVLHVDVARDRVIASRDSIVGQVVALDLDDGSVLWEREEGYVAVMADGTTVLADEETLQAVDPDGETVWERGIDPTSGLAVATDGRTTESFELLGRSTTGTADALYVGATGTTLTRVDPETGEDLWESEVKVRWIPEIGTHVAFTQAVIAVAGRDAVVGLDPETGEQLWRTTDHRLADPAGPHLVAVDRAGGQTTFYDRDGEAFAKELDRRDGWLYRSLVVDGTPYVVAESGRTLFTADMEEVATFRGAITPVAGGFYELAGRTLSLRDLGGTQRWARKVGKDDERFEVPASLAVHPVDGLVLVSVDAQVIAYG